MPITINGSGTVTGLSAGGLPDGSITSDDIAAGAVTAAKLAAGAGGKILQVVSTTKTDKFATNSTSYVDVTGLSVSITPSSVSNKILVIVNLSGASYTNTGGQWNLVRGSTNIAVGTTSAATRQVTGSFYNGQSESAYQSLFLHMTHLDSPSTTSATTYKVQVRHDSSSYYLTINSRAADDYISSVSSITAMEVQG